MGKKSQSKKFYINKYTKISIEKQDDDSDGLVFRVKYDDPHGEYSEDNSYCVTFGKLKKLLKFLENEVAGLKYTGDYNA